MASIFWNRVNGISCFPTQKQNRNKSCLEETRMYYSVICVSESKGRSDNRRLLLITARRPSGPSPEEGKMTSRGTQHLARYPAGRQTKWKEMHSCLDFWYLLSETSSVKSWISNLLISAVRLLEIINPKYEKSHDYARTHARTHDGSELINTIYNRSVCRNNKISNRNRNQMPLMFSNY